MKAFLVLVVLGVLAVVALRMRRGRGSATDDGSVPGGTVAAAATGAGVGRVQAVAPAGSTDERASVFDPYPGRSSARAEPAGAEVPSDPEPSGGSQESNKPVESQRSEAEVAEQTAGSEPNEADVPQAQEAAGPDQPDAGGEAGTGGEASASVEAAERAQAAQGDDQAAVQHDEPTGDVGSDAEVTPATEPGGDQPASPAPSTNEDDGADYEADMAAEGERAGAGAPYDAGDGAPAQMSGAEENIEQPRWTTSAWDPEHTTAEERGDPEHPQFDDEVAEPAVADETEEVKEGAFDADHADGPEDPVTPESEPGSNQPDGEESSAEESSADGPGADADASGPTAQVSTDVDDDDDEVERSAWNDEGGADRDGAEAIHGPARPKPAADQSAEEPETPSPDEQAEEAQADKKDEASDGAEQGEASGGAEQAGSDVQAPEPSGDEVERLPGDWQASEDEGPQILSSADAEAYVGTQATGSSAEDSGQGDDSQAEDSSQAGSEADQGEQGDQGEGRRTSALEEVKDGGYGMGSAAPIEDGAMPLGHPVKGWHDTRTFVSPGHPAYEEADPHVWFENEEAAWRAGFRPVT